MKKQWITIGLPIIFAIAGFILAVNLPWIRKSVIGILAVMAVLAFIGHLIERNT